MRPRLPRHQRSTVNAIGKIRDPVLGKKITACGMGRMPQAVAPLTVRKGNGPSPSFALGVAPIALNVAHASLKVRRDADRAFLG
jgi:hypothetical protein